MFKGMFDGSGYVFTFLLNIHNFQNIFFYFRDFLDVLKSRLMLLLVIDFCNLSRR